MPLTKSEYNEDALSKESTTTINGVFVVFVFLSHFSGYFTSFGFLDKPYLLFRLGLGQCVNVPFILFSGYGIGVSIKKDKNNYCKKLIKKRFINVWTDFIFIVLIYISVSCLLTKQFPPIRLCLFSLIGYENVGNSNWYIFYILCMYLGIYFSFRFINKTSISLLGIFIFTLFYSILMIFLKKEIDSQFYSTCFVMLFGIIIAFFNESIESIIKKKWIFVFCIVLILFVGFHLIQKILNFPEVCYNVSALLFASLLILICYKVRFQNRFFFIIGKNIFYVYMLQRLPMMLFLNLNIPRVLFFLICVISTIILTQLFSKCLQIKNILLDRVGENKCQN